VSGRATRPKPAGRPWKRANADEKARFAAFSTTLVTCALNFGFVGVYELNYAL
jgi:hypothetical protein